MNQDPQTTTTPRETQASIHQWGVNTFGETNALTLAVRMNLEVIELLQQLVDDYGPCPELEGMRELLPALHALGYRLNSEHGNVPAGAGPHGESAQEECADVHIMLRQLAEYLKVDLDRKTDEKMAVNRVRRWARANTGQMQHVDHFFDVGTGIRMEPGLWYVISDSGSAYTSEGFSTPTDAQHWIWTHAAEYGIPLSDVGVPAFIDATEGWQTMRSANIVLGSHCRDFFQVNDPEGWALMNPSGGRDPRAEASAILSEAVRVIQEKDGA